VVVKFGVPIATITVPAEGGTTTRTSDFSGSTTALGDSIEFWRGNTLLAKDIRITNGTWMAKGIKLDVGRDQKIDVLVRQDAHQSEAITRTVTVVPEKLIFDAPQNGQNISAQMWFSGAGAFPGDNVILKRVGANHNFTPVPVNAFGQWATRLQHNMVATDKITAFARAGAGLDSALADQITPKLLYTTAPHFTEPQAGDRTGTKPICKGLARAGSTVTVAQWFNGASVLATTVADADGRWEVQSTVALPAGANWMQARDTLAGQHSEWRRSEYFEVRPVSSKFTAPTANFPRRGQDVSLSPAISGRGLSGAVVHVYKSGAGNSPLGTFLVGRNGTWEGSLTTVLPLGTIIFETLQVRDGANSEWTLPGALTVNVVDVKGRLGTPVISEPLHDTVTLLEPNPKLAGRGFPGALIKVYLDNAQTIIAETRVKADGQWETRCDRVLAAGAHKLSAHHELDGGSAGSGFWVDFKIGPQPLPPLITNIPLDGDVPHNLVLEGKAMPGARVNLYKHGIPTVIGTGIADKDGVWTIKLYNLPLGEFIFNGKTVHGTVESGWMASVLAVSIHNFG
uniref:hypothetical protein n=1 Tax=Pseudomonas sp. TWP3-1 TaxID=2804631 RepID=UPI003CF54593